MVKWKCRQCGEVLESPQSLTGEPLECPKCGLYCRVPGVPKRDEGDAPPPLEQSSSPRGIMVGFLLSVAVNVLLTGLIAWHYGVGPLVTSRDAENGEGASAESAAAEIQALRRELLNASSDADRTDAPSSDGEIADLTARLNTLTAELEASRASAVTSEPEAPQRQSPSPAPVSDREGRRAILVPTLSSKRFDDGKYEDNIWFDVAWDTSMLPKATRAVKGRLLLMDLFGETHVTIGWTINEPLKPRIPHFEMSVGLEYNQFIDRHQWLRRTDEADLAVVFEVDSIIFADGERVDY